MNCRRQRKAKADELDVAAELDVSPGAGAARDDRPDHTSDRDLCHSGTAHDQPHGIDLVDGNEVRQCADPRSQQNVEQNVEQIVARSAIGRQARAQLCNQRVIEGPTEHEMYP